MDSDKINIEIQRIFNILQSHEKVIIALSNELREVKQENKELTGICKYLIRECNDVLDISRDLNARIQNK